MTEKNKARKSAKARARHRSFITQKNFGLHKEREIRNHVLGNYKPQRLLRLAGPRIPGVEQRRRPHDVPRAVRKVIEERFGDA